ncbi:hypothetical protein PG997_001666 [Apiospora hydei]|uniref:Uncharacterized protein n=1 Tax=Apiospora hydei TaxID=1337664 RepID=A0ABR1XED5_9PEZI
MASQSHALSPRLRFQPANVLESSFDETAAFHTKPGDTRLTVHPKIHEKLFTMAAYLGYTYPSSQKNLEKVFAWFVTSGSDVQFDAEFSGTTSQVLTCLHGVGASGTKVDVSDRKDRKATAIACLLVWASGVLPLDGENDNMSKPANLSNPAALMGTGLLVEDSYLITCMLDAVYASVDRANEERASREQTLEEAQAISIRLIPKFDEHEFEKYARIIALVRNCAQTIFEIAAQLKHMDKHHPENGDIMFPDGETVFDKQKRVRFRDIYVFGSRTPVRLIHKPIWMQTVDVEFLLVPTMGSCVHGRAGLLSQGADPVEPVQGCLSEHSRIVGKIRGTVDFGKFRKLSKLVDELCVSLRFTDPTSPRHLSSVAYCHGIFQGTSFEELAKVKAWWKPVYSCRPQDMRIPLSHIPWHDMKGHWSHMDVPRTVVVAHSPLPQQETESYPFWTGSYRFLQAHLLSTQGPKSTLTPATTVVFPAHDVEDEESISEDSDP